MSTSDTSPFVCGTIHWNNRASYAIEYIYNKCIQGAHKFFVVAPDFGSEPEYEDYESPTAYKYACEYFEDADFEGFTDRIKEAFTFAANLFVDYKIGEVFLKPDEEMERQLGDWLNVIICSDKSSNFVSKIIIAEYDQERRLSKYEKSYLEKYYQKIGL